MHDQRISTILWRGKWLIAAAVVVGAIVGYGIAKTTTKVYEASTVIQVSSASAASTNQSPSDIQNANQVLAQTYATLIANRSFLQEIQPQVAGGRFTTSELHSDVSAAAVPSTALVSLTAEADSPATARLLADGVANAFVAYVGSAARETSTAQQSKLQDQITLISRQIRSLEGRAQTPAVSEQLDSLRGARSSMQAQLASVIATGIEQGGSVRVAAPSTASSTPIRPRTLLDVLAGFLVGFLIGVLLSWLRIRLDRALHSSQEAERLLEAPLLATIPLRKRFSLDDPVLGEAFDVLRTNLAFVSVEQPLQVLTLTSFNPGEGKSSTVEGLAYAAGRGGASVVVVDADVRTRTLTRRSGFDHAPGLTSVLVGAYGLDEALVELAPGVALLPAGPTPPNPSSLLGSMRLRELLDDLRAQYSLVLLDSPPVAHLADASILASISDGIAIVARVGVTDRAHMPEAVANLRHVPTPVVGCVVLERRAVDETYYPALAKGAPTPQESLETI